MIQQIISKEAIQTRLQVKIDGVIVDYQRNIDEFAYTFTVGIGQYDGFSKTVEEAKETIMKAVAIMENQSYDHGAEWRRVECTEDQSQVERYGQYIMTVSFRIRDSY